MKRFAIVGAGNRALGMFARPIVERFAGPAALVGVCDPNATRARHLSDACGGVPVFADFDAMLREGRPDAVIVATVDRYHHEYIVRALEAGCDAITEKPMTIDADKVRAILAAERRSGRRVVVAFNYRHVPYATRVKALLRAGAIGRVLSVELEWMLDRRHGADYFRRWHRRKENSGGLLVHKATHHFDLINWWLEREPQRVFAVGARHVYGPTRSERGERCATCPYAATCEFYVDYRADPALRALYFAAEHEDGYVRDGCVFADEIDIEDTMGVSVEYAGGVPLTYSLVAYAPYEGWRAALTGTEGRMELAQYDNGPLAGGASDRIVVFDRTGAITVEEVPKAPGGHGGGDERLWQQLFGEHPPPDPLGHAAGSWAGAMSVLVGAAANRSIATGQAVAIADLLREEPTAGIEPATGGLQNGSYPGHRRPSRSKERWNLS